MIGANVKYRPLYKKFPMDIPDLGEEFMSCIIGFVTNLFDINSAYSTVLSCGHLIDNTLFSLEEYGSCLIC